MGLVTKYGEGGGLQNRRGGGACEVLPLRKDGGTEKVLAMLKGGQKKFWGSFYVEAWSLSHVEGGRKKFPLLKRGTQKLLPCLEGGGGGGGKQFQTCSFPIV